MKSLFPAKVHIYIYLLGLIMLAVGLPLSKFLMSVSQFVLLGNWIFEGNFKAKWIALKNNKPALILCSLVLLHLLGIFYSQDLNYAFKDIRIKAPLLVLPVIFSTSFPLNKNHFHIVLKVFIAAVFISTICSIAVLSGIYNAKELLDVRGASLFISHIRFALLICVAFFISIYLFKKSETLLLKIIWTLIILWWPIFLFIIQSMTGATILFLTGLGVLLYYFIKKGSFIYTLSITAIVLITVFLGNYFYKKWSNEITPPIVQMNKTNLPLKTKYDHFYWHDTNSVITENGNLVWVYVSDDELKPLWNKKSKIAYDSKDKKGNEIKLVLVRFLHYKG